MYQIQFLNHKRLTKIGALFIFALALVLKFPLIDWYQERTFTSDSEIMVEHTRAYYFFLKHPSAANAPLRLSAYPTYFPGPFITAAITANVLRNLIQWGIVDLPLTDADNSLILISMRITNWILASLTVPLIFLTLLLVTRNQLLSLFLAIAYYLFNSQQALIDLIRVDHFLLCAYCFLLYASAYCLRHPTQLKSYILLGLASACILPTKLNAIMYLLSTAIVLLWLLKTRQFSIRKFSIGLIPFTLVCLFFFIQWIMFAPLIIPTITEIVAVGGDWAGYWSIRPYGYYNYDQFFNGTYSLRVFVFMAVAGLAVLFTAIGAFGSKDKIAVWLIVLFTFFTVYGVPTPVVGRYGIFYPVLYVLVIGYGFQYFMSNFSFAPLKVAATVTFTIGMLLASSFYWGVYQNHITNLRNQEQATAAVRIGMANWVQAHIAKGSKILLYHPRVNNPPIFEMPYTFVEDILNFQFLYPDSLLKQLPPGKATLMGHCNAVLLHSHYYEYHLNTLAEFIPNEDPKITSKHQAILDALQTILTRMWVEGTNFEQATKDVLITDFDEGEIETKIAAFELEYVGAPIKHQKFEAVVSLLNPSCNLVVWKAFYEGLKSFPSKLFSSEYYTYDSKWMEVYVLSTEPQALPLPAVTALNENTGSPIGEVALIMEVSNTENISQFAFQVQFSTDSSFKWLSGPNIDGFTNPYNQPYQPTSTISRESIRWLPDFIFIPLTTSGSYEADGNLMTMSGLNAAKTQNISQIFRQLAFKLYSGGGTFAEVNGYSEMKEFLESHTDVDVDTMHFNAYLQAFNITPPVSINDFNTAQQYTLNPIHLSSGERYYWRARLKHREQAYSEWSNTASFIMTR